jgi:Na+-translocating ferredoxin:NAD+ oxidoreductase RnfG subunit
MKKGFTLIFGFLIALAGFGQNEPDLQNKRLISSLKKNNISDYSLLEELRVVNCLENPSEINGRFFKVSKNPENSDVKYVFVGRVNSCRAGGCSISSKTHANLESEYFEYCIFFDSAKTVKQVDVFNYQATHGYEITAKGWLKQFIGFSGKDTLEVNKNIDSISGATISVFAITDDVQQKTKMLKSIN